MVSILQTRILRVRVASQSLSKWSDADENPGSLIPGVGLISSQVGPLFSNVCEVSLCRGCLVYYHRGMLW